MTGRRVILVTGPPCSGKNTYVAKHRAPTDTVVDFDATARRLGSQRRWHHSKPIIRRANQAINDAYLYIAAATTGTYWVIRCVPEGPRRAALAQHLRADHVLVLLPGEAVLYERAQARPSPERTTAGIRRWLARYTPAPCDERVPAIEGAS